MADIRIKDLTTTASSTASDDFFAADGTTNGTRKLSAYSPSFGGNATVGGTLTVTGVATASAGLVIGSGSFAEGKLYYGAFGGLTIAAKTGSSYDLYIAAPDGNAIGYVPTGTKTLTLASTTASTGTSSGALVVGNGTSGGLGVGGAVNIGGTLTVGGQANFANGTTYKWDTSGDVYARQLFSGTPGVEGIKLSQGSGIGLIVALGAGGISFRDDGNNQMLNLADATGNAVFLGNITTAAPAGGTAAAWKLGTVASVSPTSPNRTIEVDIGGTIYYIHAKTTNN